MAEKPGEPGRRAAQRWVLALTSSASFLVVLDMLVVATASTAIRADLGASVDELSWSWTVNVPLRLFGSRALSAGNAAIFCLNAS